MEKAFEAVWLLAGKHAPKVGGAILFIFVAAAVWMTSMEFRVSAMEDDTKGIKAKVNKLTEGDTPYQKGQKEKINDLKNQQEKTNQKLDRIIEAFGISKPKPRSGYGTDP